MPGVLQQNWDAIVVGGGMVGAATALGLAQLDLQVLLLERNAPNLDWQGNEPFSLRVSALTRSSENILRNLNAWQGIEKRRSLPFVAMKVWEASHSKILSFSAEEIGEPNLGFTVENDWVQAALWEQIALHPQIQVLFDAQVESLVLPEDALGHQMACLSLADGSQLSTQLIVAADGAFSKIRQMSSIGLEQMDYEQCAVVGCVKTEKSHENACWQRYTKDGPFAFLAMAQGYSSIAWYMPLEKMQWALSLSDEAFAREIQQVSGNQLGVITQVADRGAFPLVRRHAKRYVKPRLALVGDAAHTINPQAGQGVNIGLLDAAALVEEVKSALGKQRDFGHLPVLRRYERARRGDNAIVQRSMEFFDWFYNQESGVKSDVRGQMTSVMDSMSISLNAKHWLMTQVLNGRNPLPELALAKA